MGEQPCTHGSRAHMDTHYAQHACAHAYLHAGAGAHPCTQFCHGSGFAFHGSSPRLKIGQALRKVSHLSFQTSILRRQLHICLLSIPQLCRELAHAEACVNGVTM